MNGFEGSVSFSQALFQGDTYFDRAHFDGDAAGCLATFRAKGMNFWTALSSARQRLDHKGEAEALAGGVAHRGGVG